MVSRSKRAAIAQQTLLIHQQGRYETASSDVNIQEELQQSIAGTRTFSPRELADLVANLVPIKKHQTEFQVVNATTMAVARRMVERDRSLDPLCLNFASAKNPGGGFINGSQAQEESLARASGLYACIAPQENYYGTNRKCGTALYTHYMIYSPKVPVFRDDQDELLETPYCTSMVTSPAVNAGAVHTNEPHRIDKIEQTMHERIERLLALAIELGHENLVLGAWGCGVFRNNPRDVADWFREFLVDDERFRNAFAKIVFAVLDHSPGKATYQAFSSCFSGKCV